MSTKYETIELDHTQVTIDVSLLKKDQLYFNATEIAKQFGKIPHDFLKLDSTAEYIQLLVDDESVPISNRIDLIRTKKGGKVQGTWLHHELAYEFAGWLSTKFRYNLHKWTKSKLKEEKNRKLQLQLAKDLHPSVTAAIKNAHDNPMFYHYSTEMDMMNKIITGHTASEYKKLHGVESVRDNLCMADIGLLNECQTRNKIMIEDDVDYAERKDRLTQYVTKQRMLLN